jgi:hypothetical protein
MSDLFYFSLLSLSSPPSSDMKEDGTQDVSIKFEKWRIDLFKTTERGLRVTVEDEDGRYVDIYVSKDDNGGLKVV